VISYKADRIGCESVEGVLIAGIGNESIGYVMFQRGTTPETGGNEPPYFEFDDQVNGSTDALKSVELSNHLLVVNTNLDNLGAEKFEITLVATEEEIDQLSSQLKLIFVGYEEMFINA